jgi:hypothetical protein
MRHLRKIGFHKEIIVHKKIFGVGFSKTGTSSLARALSILGYRTVHNPTDDETTISLLSGNLNCTAIRDNDAICDIMFCRHFRELDRLYPDSLFILTERDKDGWHASCTRHWASRTIRSTALHNEELVDFQVYGTALYRRDLFNDAYNAHYAAVLGYFEQRPSQLLRMNICAGDGWGILCSHLSVSVPSVRFPCVRPEPWSPSVQIGVSRSSATMPMERSLVGH